MTKRNKECILIIVIDKNSFYQNISLFKEKTMNERSTTNPPFPYTRNQEALKDFEVLKQVENQTPEICMEAVKKYGWALRLIENQTP